MRVSFAKELHSLNLSLQCQHLADDLAVKSEARAYLFAGDW